MKNAAGASRASRVKFALDSSCLVALLADWHPRHRATAAAYERRLAAGQQPLIAGHAVLECFSVLTRLPGSVRVSPEAALQALSLTFRESAEIACLEPEDYWALLGRMGEEGRGGGLVYDAAIAWASFRAGAAELLTWNVRDLRPIASPWIQVREP